jgi:hypothetical protein
MFTVLTYLFVFIVGIIVGGLIWRNNAKKFERLEKAYGAKVEAVIGAVK